jgi:hypothetical protein
MNNELKKFIESELELNGLLFSEKYGKVQEKVEELKNVTRELESYLDAEIAALSQPVQEIGDKIKVKFPEITEYTNRQYCYELNVPFKVSGAYFNCSLSFNFDSLEYQSGIYSSNKRRPDITEFLKPLYDTKIIDDCKDEEWYGFKILPNQNEALEHFTNLIKAVEAEKEKWDNQTR